ncbi:MAG: signal peptidase I, partial [Sphingomonas sp.]
MTQATTAPAPSSAPVWREVREIGVTLAAALILAMVIRILLFQPFTIPSSSMEPGLVTGDYIVVSKYAYGWSRASLPFNPPLPDGRLLGRQPERGDVVVFRRPHDPDEVWIKRVIGLPGDTVQVRRGRSSSMDRASLRPLSRWSATTTPPSAACSKCARRWRAARPMSPTTAARTSRATTRRSIA